MVLFGRRRIDEFEVLSDWIPSVDSMELCVFWFGYKRNFFLFLVILPMLTYVAMHAVYLHL